MLYRPRIPALKPLEAILYTLGCLALYYLFSWIGIFREVWVNQFLFLLLPGLVGRSLFLERPTGFRLPPLKDFAVLIGLSLAVCLTVNLLSIGWTHLFPPPEAYREIFKRIPKPFLPWEQPYLVFAFCLAPALAEEILMRGFLMDCLKTWRKPLAIGIPALIFALAHLNPWQFPLFLILGIFLGWSRLKWNNLLFPVTTHFLNNLIALVWVGLSF